VRDEKMMTGLAGRDFGCVGAKAVIQRADTNVFDVLRCYYPQTCLE